MIHYLVIGHVCDEDQQWQHMMFNDEQPDEYLEKKFIKSIHDDESEYIDREIYIDFIIKSKNSMVINHG
tara:strand:+ start:156 stop:362 length:207 start_codon:yes stop_codon:yes gene_type:complete